MVTKLLPGHLHVSAMGIGTALGAVGSTTFPIAAGEIADRKGQFPPPFGCRLFFLTDYQDYYDSAFTTRDVRSRMGFLVLAPKAAVKGPSSVSMIRGNDCSAVALEIAKAMRLLIGLEPRLFWDGWRNRC